MVFEIAKLVLTHRCPRIYIALLITEVGLENHVLKYSKEFETIPSFDLELRSQCGLVGRRLHVEEDTKRDEECRQEDCACE